MGYRDFFSRNRKFESISLQQRVRCEPASRENSPFYAEKPRYSAGVRAGASGGVGTSTIPWLEAPSPKKVMRTPPSPRNLAAIPAPQMSGAPAPRMPLAFAEVGDMHRTTLAVAGARRLPVDLGHHFAHIDAFGDAMAVAAMGRRNPVAIGEMQHYPRGAGFFAGIEVNEPRNVTLGEFDVQTFLEFSDRAHDPVSFEQIGLRQREWTPATSTVRKAFSTSLINTWSCPEKKISRSPSSAIEPCLRRGSKGVSAGMRCHSSMPIKSMRPGAIGALTMSLASAAGARRIISPPASRRLTGARSDPQCLPCRSPVDRRM
jgi:hypothetical protein